MSTPDQPWRLAGPPAADRARGRHREPDLPVLLWHAAQDWRGRLRARRRRAGPGQGHADPAATICVSRPSAASHLRARSLGLDQRARTLQARSLTSHPGTVHRGLQP